MPDHCQIADRSRARGAERLAELEAVAERYAIGLTPALAALVRPGDPADPIARQFVPDARELIRDPAESDDPIGDDAMSPVKGLVHRYPDRVLIKLVAVCAVYCRFCFRRERVGPGSGALSAAEFAAALDYVRAHTGVWEVILTGGDPLTLAPRRIAEATRALAEIDARENVALAYAPARRRAGARDARRWRARSWRKARRRWSRCTPTIRVNSPKALAPPAGAWRIRGRCWSAKASF